MMHIFLIFAVIGAPAANADVPITVNASGLNLRTASGSILCEVKANDDLVATGRADGDWIKIKVNRAAPNCPKEGFVHSSYVSPKVSTVASINGARVDSEGLSLRNDHNADEDSFECALPKNTQLELANEKSVYDKDAELTFVKVKLKNPVQGCPNEGWVAKTFLKSLTGVTNVSAGNLNSLPRVTRLTANSDNVADCNGAGCNKQIKSDTAISQMNKVSTGIGTKIDDEPAPRPPMPIPTVPANPPPVIRANTYLNALNALIKNPYAKGTGLNTNRGLVQVPLLGSRGNIGPCGSHHYLPNRPIGQDAYANPLTACVFTSILQDWKKNVCPDRDGCTIQWGDISDRDDPGFHGDHKSHTVGYCIDFRPMRKGGFEDSALTYQDGNYDRAMTRKLVGFLRSRGVNVNQFFFNDTGLGTRPMVGHSNHIHACFPPSAVTRSVCQNLKVDPEVCPEIK